MDKHDDGQRAGGERGGATDERDGESATARVLRRECGGVQDSATDEGSSSERDGGERGGATDERCGNGATVMSGAAHGESATGRREGRARRRQECDDVTEASVRRERSGAMVSRGWLCVRLCVVHMFILTVA